MKNDSAIIRTISTQVWSLYKSYSGFSSNSGFKIGGGWVPFSSEEIACVYRFMRLTLLSGECGVWGAGKNCV